MAKRSIRQAFAEAIIELAEQYPNLVVLEADLQESTQSIQFHRRFPERYFQMGVSEQNMTGVAVGLALSGKIPITHTFACFQSMRAAEHVRTSAAYTNANVKLFVSHSGVSSGSAGTSHHAIEDIAIMRAIPNLTVVVPGDFAETKQMARAVIEHVGPVYIRGTANDAEDVYEAHHRFVLGKATLLRDGSDATIISTGTLVRQAVLAAETLSSEGTQVRVLQMATVKPLDRESVIRAAHETGVIVTVEEHNIIGGLGSAVCEIVAQEGRGRVRVLGVRDHFCGVGSPDYLLAQEGLTAEAVAIAVRELKP